MFTHIQHRMNIASERLAKTVCLTKSQSSLLNIYFRLSGFQPSLLLIHFRYGPNTCSHCTKVWHRTHLIYEAPLSRLARGKFPPLQRSPRNHRNSYVLTEAPSGVVCYTAVFSVVTQALRDDTKNGCAADYIWCGFRIGTRCTSHSV